MLRRRLILPLLTLAALTLGTAAAAAAPAVAASTLNVRTGPGTDFPVVDVLNPGEIVDVQYCKGLWCYLEKSGPDGWASAKYLAAGNQWNDDDIEWYDEEDEWDGEFFMDTRPGFRPRPHWRPMHRDTVCTGGGNFTFCLGN